MNILKTVLDYAITVLKVIVPSAETDKLQDKKKIVHSARLDTDRLVQETVKVAEQAIVSNVTETTFPAIYAKTDTEKMDREDALLVSTYPALSVKMITMSVLTVFKITF